MKIDIARSRDCGAARIEALERRLQLLVDRVVLAHRVDIAEVEIRGEPWRVVVRDPHRDRGMVLQHRDHLSLLLARRGLAEARLIASGVMNVGGGQRKVLPYEATRFVSEA